MDLGLTDRVVLIVGGSGYLGSAAAREFVREGAHVVLGGRDRARLERVAGELGGGTSVVVLDTRDEPSVRAVVDAVVAEHGRLDVLVNTAAPPADRLDPARDRDPAQILEAIDAKALGYLRTSVAAIPAMRAAGFGRIIQIAGQNSRLTASVTATARNVVVDTAAKALADDLAGTGVTVNVVAPGAVLDDPPAEVAPGRPGASTPAQVAATILFLASEAAGGISGETIAVGHRVRGVQ
jgi:NAD(P)-dependent dehydrogenase (short-subunit alcohol dehydrogenase family)